MSLENLSMTSDYPMDKIIYFHEGEYERTQSALVASIPHNLPFIPLISCIITTDDWQTTHSEPCIDPNVYLETKSDRIDVYIFSSIGTKIKARFYGFEPSNSTAIVQETSSDAEKFILNSDYSYMKLYSSGVVAADSSNRAVVNHNLGYIPLAICWEEYTRESETTILSLQAITDSKYTKITDSQIIFQEEQSHPNLKFHYRIYANEA